MRKFLVLTVSAAGLAIAGAAVAQTAPAAGTSATAQSAGTERASHRLDPAEREARKHAAFERLDADHNGAITYAEFSATHRRSSARSAAASDRPRGGRGTGAPRASALDADGDGVVTREEYLAAMQRRFDRLDSDHDGRLSLAERRPGAHRASADE